MSKFIDYWKDKFAGKNENSPAFRRNLAKKINSSSLKYVSERLDDEETVVCHKGYITVIGDELEISGVDKGAVFRAKIDTLSMNELLSMDGIILTGFDILSGRERSIVAYYTYYRKVD